VGPTDGPIFVVSPNDVLFIELDFLDIFGYL